MKQIYRNSYQIDRTTWQQLDILNQMGNIGSEVGQTTSAARDHDSKRTQAAIERALDLFDATIEVLTKARSPRGKEVLRAKDQFLRLFFDDRFEQDADAIEQYFMNYALAARRKRTV